MKKIGYARVSTKDQNLEMQIEAMKHAGCDKIYMEKKSGRKLKNRPVLRRLLKQSTAGDILIVWKIDRLGRSARELLEVHIPADTRSAFPVISVQSPVSIQCCWQS